MSAPIGYGNCYEAFRHIQASGTGMAQNVSLNPADDGKIQISSAKPEPAKTAKLRETFAAAVKIEIDDGTEFVSPASIARQERNEKIANVMKNVGKGIGLTLLGLTGVGLIGMGIYFVFDRICKKRILDYEQTDLIAKAVEQPQFNENAFDEDDDDDVTVVKDKTGNNDKKIDNPDEIIEGAKAKLFDGIKDRNGEDSLTTDDISYLMDKVESFRAKRKLLRSKGINAFLDSNDKNCNKTLKTLRYVCRQLFTESQLASTIWKSISDTVKKLSPEQLQRFKGKFKNSIIDTMTANLLVNYGEDTFRKITDSLTVDKKTIVKFSPEMANIFAKELNVVVHDMLIAELDSHRDR